MEGLVSSDSLKAFGLNIGTLSVWMIDWIPFVLQTVSSILFIVYMSCKINQIRRKQC